MSLYLGLDTSNYTTSVACCDGLNILQDERIVLSVQGGQRGLRQSEALFQHIKNLPILLEKVLSAVDTNELAGICVSQKPTADESSYMPVFLAGMMQARGLAAALKIPLRLSNHQSGHIRAALVGNEELIGRQFFAIHLSGGTTDVLLVDESLCAEPLGKSKDLHAGQLVDRVGVALGCPFPCGKHMEKMAREAVKCNIKLASAVKGLDCSLSGAESAAQRLIAAGANANEISFAVYDCLSRTLAKVIANLQAQYGQRPVLLCGGVASSLLLRELLEKRLNRRLYYSQPKLASDNAVGIALMNTLENKA